MKKGGYVLWSFLTGQFFAFYMYSNILETRVSFIGFKKHNSQKIKIENVTLSYFLFIDAIWTKIIRQILVLKIPLYAIQKGRGDMLALWCLWDIMIYFIFVQHYANSVPNLCHYSGCRELKTTMHWN